MGRTAIVGAEWIDPEAGAARPGTLLIEGGRLAGFASTDADLTDWRRVDRTGAVGAPGFLDLHFHGELVSAGPDDFSAALARAAREQVESGTTAFLATTVCWPDADLAPRLDALAQATEATAEGGAACLGLHLEGPWISAAAPGAMDPGGVRPFDPARDRPLIDGLGERLCMVTFAPELPGADALLAALMAQGVVPALGHSAASAEQIEAAASEGLCHATHLWNAMGPFHHRAPGVAGAVLADDRIRCDLICDGHHVAPAVVRLSAAALGERLMLISDRVAVPSNGPSALGAAAAEGPDAPFRRADGTLVGSQLRLDRAVANLRRFADVGLAEAIAAVTLRPARQLGVEAERGTLRPGALADLALLDAEGAVVETWRSGEPVWSRATDG
ncbi:MAG: amidohydrolase family protein [Myxococcota bacterium]